MLDYLLSDYDWFTLTLSITFFILGIKQLKYVKLGYGCGMFLSKGLILPKKATTIEKNSLIFNTYGVFVISIAFLIFTFIPR